MMQYRSCQSVIAALLLAWLVALPAPTAFAQSECPPGDVGCTDPFPDPGDGGGSGGGGDGTAYPVPDVGDRWVWTRVYPIPYTPAGPSSPPPGATESEGGALALALITQFLLGSGSMAAHQMVAHIIAETPDLSAFLTNVMASQLVPKTPHQSAPQADNEGNRTGDPIDAGNGELYWTHTDLAFPGFGVPYRHARMYRSRISYDGPQGWNWDHSLNQRLVPSDSDSCDGEMLFLTGQGTVLAFSEVTTTVLPSGGHEVSYESPKGSFLRLTGEGALGRLTWEMRHPSGESRLFDSRGLLVRWRDANLKGLAIEWEAAPGAALWRVARVTDSVGRVIAYEYDASGRLERIEHAASGLSASYEYDTAGDLVASTSATGETKSYKYRNAGPPLADAESSYLPEGQLQLACETMCAPEGTSCRAGGACDDMVAQWQDDCPAKCLSCESKCDEACDQGCTTLCENDCPGTCATDCAAMTDADFEEVCDDLWDDEVESACGQCGQTCLDSCHGSCALVHAGAPDWLYHDLVQECANDCYWCCADGIDCQAGSCNSGQVCEESCEAAFFTGVSWGQQVNSAGQPVLDAGGAATCGYSGGPQQSCVGRARSTCPQTCNDSCEESCAGGGTPVFTPGWFPQSSCMMGCVPTCKQECDEDACLDRCAATDIAAECQSGCVEGCVEMGRAEGPFAGPKWGHPEELAHNLTKITDGRGVVVLENRYGEDIRDPNFDKVVWQQNGTRELSLTYLDFAGAPVTSPTCVGLDCIPDVGTAIIDAFVDLPGQYAPVEICPDECSSLTGPRLPDVTVLPAGEVLVIMPDTTPLRPEIVIRGVDRNVLLPRLTMLSFGAQRGGPLVRAPGGERLGALSMKRGRNMMNLVPRGERYALTGQGASEMSDLGDVMFVASGPSLLGYKGRPRALVHVAEGACTKPFQASVDVDGGLTITPADACSPDVVFAPMATAARYGADPSADLFAPQAVVPSRQAIRWVRDDSGRYEARPAPRKGSAPTSLGRVAFETLRASPLLRASQPSAPLFAFHVPVLQRTRPGLSIIDSTIRATPVFDADTWHTRPVGSCKDRFGGAPLVGRGELPAYATLVMDEYEVPATFYYDDRGRLLRSVNHGTGATRSYEYDAEGLLVGMLRPMGDRTCLQYDELGNVPLRAEFSAPVGHARASETGSNFTGRLRIDHRTDFTQSFPSRPTKTWDPRDPTRALVTRTWDAKGNLTSVTDGAGFVETFTPSPMGPPVRIEAMDGSVTTIAYDSAAGLPKRVTVDAEGADPLTTVTQYDEAGRPKQITTPLGEVRAYLYDGGQLDTVTSVAGASTVAESYEHDDGLLTEITSSRAKTALAYDANRRVTTVTETALDGSAPTRTTCSLRGPDGRVLESIDADGTRTRLGYDGERRLQSEEVGLLESTGEAWELPCQAQLAVAAASPYAEGGEVASYFYDEGGFRVETYDALGQLTRHTPDAFGRPWKTEHPEGAIVRLSRDSLGNVTGSTVRGTSWSDLLGETVTSFDIAGRLESHSVAHADSSGAAVNGGWATTSWNYSELAQGKVSRTDPRRRHDNGDERRRRTNHPCRAPHRRRRVHELRHGSWHHHAQLGRSVGNAHGNHASHGVGCRPAHHHDGRGRRGHLAEHRTRCRPSPVLHHGGVGPRDDDGHRCLRPSHLDRDRPWRGQRRADRPQLPPWRRPR